MGPKQPYDYNGSKGGTRISKAVPYNISTIMRPATSASSAIYWKQVASLDPSLVGQRNGMGNKISLNELKPLLIG